MKLILIFLSLFAVKTCDNTQNNMTAQNTTLSGVYHINSFSDLNLNDHILTIAFDEETKQVSGFSGCNRFSGTYTVNKNSITMGPLASTRMFCDTSKNNIDTKLLELLAKVDTFKTNGDFLSLASNNNVLINADKTQKEDEPISFEYVAHSRGTFKHIIISKKQISIQNNRGDASILKNINKTHWNTLLKALKPIDIENIPNLKAPSENRFFDGAAIANLKITYEGKTYESQSFDHGNPPKEIAQLVKEMLSISENIE
ncbi:META domain-containing protein [Mariniflexile gromovii]|uniref:META domain-containing protein n=1 Tax=Mariniflexile gromovii TaxID=362523 RepID=A0ABS4BQ38_9FLAO|nr:META domain-containing protein [Mariniflexile gromovii]MBP0902699.1 META domain-containing protein [Mariniflexile gromovii]